MHKQYVVILETGETRLHFFPWNLCKQWVWKRNESKYKCLTCLCRRDLQLKNRSRAKATVAWGLSFISVEFGWQKARYKAVENCVIFAGDFTCAERTEPHSKEPCTSRCSDWIQGGYFLSVSISQKILSCQGKGQNNFQGFGGENPNILCCDHGLSSLGLATF